jgi:uracil-xanthine permease
MAARKKPERKWIVYGIDEKPPGAHAWIFGFQHYLTMFGATVSIPLLLGGFMNATAEEMTVLISTIFFVSGITTLLQTSKIGSGLPIVQGGSYSFLPPIFTIMVAVAAAEGITPFGVGEPSYVEKAMPLICGAIFVMAFFEIVIGYSGLFGKLRRVITPVTIGPVIALIGLALFGAGAPKAGGWWPLAAIFMILFVLYSQFLSKRYRLFLFYPVLLAIITAWIISAIGTAAGVVPVEVVGGRPVAHVDTTPIAEAKWISPPYPGQWGIRFDTAFIIGMVAAYIASMVESFGDYHSICLISEREYPTEREISKGLGAEGLGCMISGLFGGFGSTSYSENIAAVGLTRCASRYAIQLGAIIMIVLACIGKFGAIFATMPDAIVGGLYCVVFGMIVSVGLMNLTRCDMSSPRNLFIVGFIFFFGLSLPAYFGGIIYGGISLPAREIGWLADIGVAGDVIKTLFSSSMATAVIFGIILDNLIPGTDKERGIIPARQVW